MDGPDRFDTELNILRALLLQAIALAQRDTSIGEIEALLQQLSDYVWSNQEHRIVYECLRIAWRVRTMPLRQEMASKATRLGHPDVDWDSYFKQPDESFVVADLISHLKSNSL